MTILESLHMTMNNEEEIKSPQSEDKQTDINTEKQFVPPVENKNIGNIWDNNANPNPAPKKPIKKKKYTWGMAEVLISLIGLLVLQIAMALILIVTVVAKNITPDATAEEYLKVANEAIMNPIFIIISSAGMYLCWVTMMWYSTRFRGRKSWLKDFWLKFKKVDILIGLGMAVLGFIIVQGIAAFFGAIGVDMSNASNTEAFTSQSGIWKYVLFIGMVSLIGPFMEELFFRGFLMQALIKHFRRGNISSPRGGFSAWVQENSALTFYLYIEFRRWCYKHKYAISAILSSVFFGFMHFQGTSMGEWVVVIATGTLGLAFAIITIKTKRLGPAILGHIFYNGTVAIIALSGM